VGKCSTGCGRDATHGFAVLYQGEMITGEICKKQGDAAARERQGRKDPLQPTFNELGGTPEDLARIGPALTDPSVHPRTWRLDPTPPSDPPSGRGLERGPERGL
jgi:hypothetical protein